MGLTRFPHGVFASPNIGAGSERMVFWPNSVGNPNIQFVDGDVSCSSDGNSPATAVKSISEAVANVERGGTIYVKPRLTAGSAQTYYTDNITIPLTKPNISIIGCGSDVDNPYGGVDIKGLVTTSPVITVNGAGLTLDGLRLAGTGLGASISTVYAADNSTTSVTNGLTIRNCRFGNGRGHGADSAAVYLNSSWFNKIENCIFTDNMTGIAAVTTSGGITNGLTIRYCTFGGVTTNRDCDIYISGGATSNGLEISHCIFNDGLPAHSGGTIGRFIDIVNEITGTISWCVFATTSDDSGDFHTNGSLVVRPDTVFMPACWYEAAAAAKGIVVVA
jgi:parallel beta-helix repeat protein